MTKGESTREEILNVSLELFSKNGFAGTSVRQIARGVGIRESGIYNHFSSKNDIFKEISNNFKSSATGSNLLNDDLIEQLDDPYKFLNDFCEKLITLWNNKNERRFIRLLLMEQYSESSQKITTLNEYMNEARSMWWMIFDELIKHSLIKENDAKVVANEFISPLYMIRIEHMAEETNNNLKEIFDMVHNHIDFFFDSIRIE
jgi:AcrR family transcriptional regulator